MTTHTIPLDADKIDEVLLKSDTYPALTNNTAQFLRGDGTFAEVTSSVSTHESTHRSNGTDALDVKNLAGYPGDTTTFLRGDGSFATIPVDKLTDLAVADDVTTHNATTTRPGLCPKGEGTGTKYLKDNLTWDTPASAGLTYPGSSTVFLNGNGGWATPTASGSVFKPAIYIGPTGSGAEYECDGVADDVQFNAAFDSAVSGSTICILAGTYAFSNRVYSSGKNLNIIGIGYVLININTSAVVHNGFCFEGTQIGSAISLTANSDALDKTVTLSSASSVRAGDIIKLYNSDLWSELDYPTQKTGEMYVVKSVSGNDVTLREPLLRAYTTAKSSAAIIYRPIEINIDNIRIQDSDETDTHEAIALLYCINSTVSNCWIRDSGFAGISFYECYNVRAFGNDIQDCTKAGSGYGIGIWSGTAYADIYSNHIENCRHCITMNSDRIDTLTRGVRIHHNTLIGGLLTDALVIDAHSTHIDWIIDHNDITIQSTGGCYACNDGALITIFENNHIRGGYGAVIRRGSLNGCTRIIRDNTIEGTVNSFLYRGWGSGVGEHLEISGNTITKGRYGIYFGDNSNESESYYNIVIRDNYMTDFDNDAIFLMCNVAGMNIIINGNTIQEADEDGIRLQANDNAPSFVDVSNNKILDCNDSNGAHPGITITDISYATIENNKIYDSEEKNGIGIATTGTSDYNILIGNVARGMTGTKFSLTGDHNQDDNYEL